MCVKSHIGWIDCEGIVWVYAKSHIDCIIGETRLYK
jgi:hypothetical protein